MQTALDLRKKKCSRPWMNLACLIGEEKLSRAEISYTSGLEATANDRERDAIIIEFKVQDSDTEAELADTVEEALKQIEEKQYEAILRARGIPTERIKKYGFAFCGKKVLIGRAG